MTIMQQLRQLRICQGMSQEALSQEGRILARHRRALGARPK